MRPSGNENVGESRYSTRSTPPTPDAILSAGREAAMLLDSPVFMSAVETALWDIQGDWSRTKPEEGNARDALYWEQRALFRLLLRLRVAVNEAQALNLEYEQRTHSYDDVG